MRQASASSDLGSPPLPADHESPGHALGPSAWPIWFAASCGVAFLGLAFAEPTLLVGGLLLIAAATVGWGADAVAEWRAKEAPTDAATGTPASGWGRAFAGTFIAILGASIMAALVVATPPSQAGTTGGGPAPSPSGSPAPGASASPGGAATVPLVAHNIAFGTTALTAPANTPFTIAFDNEDPGVPHNVQIKDATGASVFRGDLVTGPAQVAYQVPALPPGTYTFLCDVHPTTMTGTLTVK